jgi:hypothetical protein
MPVALSSDAAETRMSTPEPLVSPSQIMPVVSKPNNEPSNGS